MDQVWDYEKFLAMKNEADLLSGERSLHYTKEYDWHQLVWKIIRYRYSTPELEAFGFFYLKSYAFWFIIKQSLNLRICLFYTFIQNAYAKKKVFKKKG